MILPPGPPSAEAAADETAPPAEGDVPGAEPEKKPFPWKWVIGGSVALAAVGGVAYLATRGGSEQA